MLQTCDLKRSEWNVWSESTLRPHLHQTIRSDLVSAYPLRPAEYQMQLNPITSIGSCTERNGTEISGNQALGLIQSKHSVSFSAAPYTCNGIQLHLVLSRTREDLH